MFRISPREHSFWDDVSYTFQPLVKEYRPREFIFKTPQPRHPIRSSERGGRSVLSEGSV